MNVLKSLLCLLIVAILCPLPVRPAAAAVQLTVMPVAGNVFVLQGKDLDGIAALDFQFNYDPAVMTNPQGGRGELIPGDAIFNFNPAVPGFINLRIRTNLESVSGSGTLATISFEGVGDAPGSILSLSANLVSVKATPVIAAVQILRKLPPPVEPAKTGSAEKDETSAVTSPEPFADSDAGTAAGMAGAVGEASGFAASGSVVMPHERVETERDTQGDFEEQVRASEGEEMQPTERIAMPPEPRSSNAESKPPAPAQVVKTTQYQSVLDRMKAYTGERTPAALTALFSPVAGRQVHQDPAIVTSDGESVVTLRVELPPTLKDTPGFSFRNANMMSLEQTDDGTWLIVLLPRKNVIEARVTIRFDGSVIVYPLVVSPPVDPALLALSGSPEAAFARFLKQQGADRDPRFDLNGDGRFDYLDDYIFTAQYLAARQKAPGKNIP